MLDLARIRLIELHDAVLDPISLTLPSARIEFEHLAAYVPTTDPSVDEQFHHR